MPSSVLERTNEQLAETIEKAARATSKMNGMLQEYFDDAKVLARRSAHRTEELLDGSRTHIKRHPLAAVTGGFALGLGVGFVMGWVLRRK